MAGFFMPGGRMYLTDLASILRAAGLTVVEVPGWQTRTVPKQTLYGPYGGLVHHTATPDTAKGDYPSENVVTYGRSDLQGPLAQLGQGRSGTWYVIAAGYANHAGPVDDPDYANWRCIGVEVEHAGIKKMPRKQRRSLITGCAALGIAYSITWRGHKEAAYPLGRKIDPHILDMDWLRKKIAKKEKRLMLTAIRARKIARKVIAKRLPKLLRKDPTVVAMKAEIAALKKEVNAK